MKDNFVFLAFVPLVLSNIFCKIYVKLNQSEPANFTMAPWWVKLLLNGGYGNFLGLRKSAFIHLSGIVLAAIFISSSIVYKKELLIFIPIFLILIVFLLLSIRWMDKNKTWGTERDIEGSKSTQILSIIAGDWFIKFSIFALTFVIVVLILDS